MRHIGVTLALAISCVSPIFVSGWQGHVGVHYPVPLNRDGIVAETPDMELVKAQDLAGHSEAKAKALQSIGTDWANAVGHSDGGYSQHFQQAPLDHDGTVAETPEVRAAKAAHLAAVAQANSHSSYQGLSHRHVHYYQPAHLKHDGTVAETPEVQAARAQHLAAHAEAKSKNLHSHGTFWHQPTPLNHHFGALNHHLNQPAPLNSDGTVAETPEVQAAKARHLSAHADVVSRAVNAQDNEWS